MDYAPDHRCLADRHLASCRNSFQAMPCPVQVDERAQGCVVEKFAEVLAVRNKEYNALVQSAKAAAAKAHSEGSQLKGELESLRSQIRQLKVGGGQCGVTLCH